MTASIGSFTFDAMRGRLAPAASMAALVTGQNQRGEDMPISGTVITEKKITTTIADAVALSASYRAIIGEKKNCVINDTSITDVVIIDCRTSFRSCKSGLTTQILMAEWTLTAPKAWNP